MKNRSASARFWEKPEIVSLTNQEQLTYLKILTTSSVYNVHGLTYLNAPKKPTRKRIPEHQVSKEYTSILAKKGLIVYDELNSIVFIPGSASDDDSQINNLTDLRFVMKRTNHLPITSIAMQSWCLSWFLNNLENTKISVVQDFLTFVKPWIKVLFTTVDSSVDYKDEIDLNELIFPDNHQTRVSISNITSKIIKDQKCFPGILKTFSDELTGPSLENRINIYIKRRDVFISSIANTLLNQFYSLYFEKKGVQYTRQNKDLQTIAMMGFKLGVEQVREKMRLYFESLDYVHSIEDFKKNFQLIDKVKKEDLSVYWEILGEYEQRERRNN